MQMAKGQELKESTGSFSLPSSHPLSLPSLSCFLSSFFFFSLEVVHLLPLEKAGDIWGHLMIQVEEIWFCPGVHFYYLYLCLGASLVKNLPTNSVDSRVVGLIPGSGRSSGEGNGRTLQYSCLGNPMNRGAWWESMVSQKSQKVLSD